MLGHLSFGVSDLARAGAFYDTVLAPLGWVRLWNGPTALGYGPPGGLRLAGPACVPGTGAQLAQIARLGRS